MEPDEGPTDCSDDSQGYDNLADHPAVFKKQRISPSFEMAEKSDVLLQRKGHAMKDRIALFVIVILACQFSPSYLARTSADQIGIASVYSVESGRRTASGQELNREALTAAHRTLPLGTKVKVTNKSNGQSVVVTINDRGPFVRGRIIDVSPAAARVLGFSGLTHVTVNGE
jgi:peptidoglycan lytic transglycosylase